MIPREKLKAADAALEEAMTALEASLVTKQPMPRVQGNIREARQFLAEMIRRA